MSRTVLLVDDDRDLAEALADGLADRGFTVQTESDGARAAERLRAGGWGVLVTDLRMPRVDGLELLALSRQLDPGRPVIVMTAFSAVESAIESIRRGAFHYLTKPFSLDELALFVERAFALTALADRARALEDELQKRSALGALVATSPSMRHVCELLGRVARSSATVLLTGESGTGKSIAARALHEESGRPGPFVTLNCAAVPETLLESELFGHVKGAFTGASAARQGLLAEADGGTFFLDEIGEMSPAMQAKLLDVIERGMVRPLGSNREQAIDVRFVAATLRDLREEIEAGRFREDLYYRLAVVTAELPPLRHRRDDIALLSGVFLERARAHSPGARGRRFSPTALQRLLEGPWPGNVRELENVVERAVLLSPGEEIGDEHLPGYLQPGPEAAGFRMGETPVTMRAMQRRYAEWVLEQVGGHRGRACTLLDIDPKTLRKLLAGDEG